MRRAGSSALPSFSSNGGAGAGSTAAGSSSSASAATPSSARGASAWHAKCWLLFYVVLGAYACSAVAFLGFGWVPHVPLPGGGGGTRHLNAQARPQVVAVAAHIQDAPDADAARRRAETTLAPDETVTRAPDEAPGRPETLQQALGLVHLPEPTTKHPYFHVFPVPHVATEDPALLSGLRNGDSRELWTLQDHERELARLKQLVEQAKQETERLRLLTEATEKLLAEEQAELEEKRARDTLDLRLVAPRVVRDELECVGWKQTGACSPYGRREPEQDKTCTQIATGGVSGYCELRDPHTDARFRAMQLNCSSVRDHVVFSCAQAADFANFGLRAQQVFETAQQQNEADPAQLLGNAGSGDGIVMVVYPKLLTSVYASLSVLRSYNCSLPIELWVTASELGRTPAMTPTLTLLQERFSNVSVEMIRDPTVSGFSTKIHAVHHSKFRNVLFLDADNVPVRDPTYLFASEEFQTHGAVFWPDFWHPDNTIFNIQRESLLWELVDLPFVDMFEQESGQLLVDRRRAAVALEVVMFFAYHRPSHFERLVLAHGDKDLFRLGWLKSNTPYYMVPFPPASAGSVRGPVNKFCGMTMVQYDAQGQVLFLHRNAKKLNGKVDHMDDKFWTHLQEFKWDVSAQDMGEGDEDRRGGSRPSLPATERLMPYEDVKRKYLIGIQGSAPLFPEFESCYGSEPEALEHFNLTQFSDLPFAGLEQQLVDYAHEAALLTAAR